MKKKLVLALALSVMMAVSGCGASDNAKNEEKAETAVADEEANAADEGEATADATDAGKYLIDSYEANGTKVDHETLVTAGMGDTYLELLPDGTGTLYLYNKAEDITWKDGKVTIFGTSDYTYEIDGDVLYLDMQGVFYTMIKEGGSAAAASEEDTGNESTASADKADKGGDGKVSTEEVMKGYVWFSDILDMKTFDMTYEDVRDYFGTDGLFDKEEYSEHMKANYRYYKWVSDTDDSIFLYVNFKEDEDGVYRVSSYNSSGFTASDASAKYLDELKAKSDAESAAAVANAGTKKETFKISKFAHEEDYVNVSVELPAVEWSMKTFGSDIELVNADDPELFGAGFIKFSLKDTVEDFDFYKDSFENYQEIEGRTIGGIEMKGRTYKNVGYEWTEYIGEYADGKAIAVGIVRVDTAPGTVGGNIIDSISFE